MKEATKDFDRKKRMATVTKIFVVVVAITFIFQIISLLLQLIEAKVVDIFYLKINIVETKNIVGNIGNVLSTFTLLITFGSSLFFNKVFRVFSIALGIACLLGILFVIPAIQEVQRKNSLIAIAGSLLFVLIAGFVMHLVASTHAKSEQEINLDKKSAKEVTKAFNKAEYCVKKWIHTKLT